MQPSLRLDSRFTRHLSKEERKEFHDLFSKSLILRKAITKVLTAELELVILEEETVDLSSSEHPALKIAADRAVRRTLRSTIKLMLPEDHNE